MAERITATTWLAEGWCRHAIFNLEAADEEALGRGAQTCLAVLQDSLATAGGEKPTGAVLHHDRSDDLHARAGGGAGGPR